MQLFIVVFFVIALLVALKVGIEESEKKREEEREQQERLEKERIERERKAREEAEKRRNEQERKRQQLASRRIITCVQCSQKIDNTQSKCPHCGTPMEVMKFDNVGMFTESLKQLSKEQLLATIKDTYLNIKGSCTQNPALGYNGCIEMASLLLLINYVGRYNKNINELYLTFGIAVNGADAVGWTNFTDAIIETTQVISKKDWTDSYCYLKAYFFDEINTFEFAKPASLNHKAPVFEYHDINIYLNFFRRQGMNV